MLTAARAGQGTVSFMTLHAVSAGFFALKGLLVLALAWRLTARVRGCEALASEPSARL